MIRGIKEVFLPPIPKGLGKDLEGYLREIERSIRDLASRSYTDSVVNRDSFVAMSGGIDNYGELIDALDSKIASIESELLSIESALLSHDNTFNQMNTQFNDVYTQIGYMNNSIANNYTNLNKHLTADYPHLTMDTVTYKDYLWGVTVTNGVPSIIIKQL